MNEDEKADGYGEMPGCGTDKGGDGGNPTSKCARCKDRVANWFRTQISRITLDRWIEIALIGGAVYVAVQSATWTHGQLNVMRETLNATRTAFESDRRAWMVPTRMEPLDIKPNTPDLVATVVIENVGRTPAKNTRTDQASGWMGDDFVPKYIEDEMAYFALYSRSVIGPSRTITVNPPIDPIPENVFAAIVRGEINFYIFGKVLYDDEFQRDRPATFCGVWQPGTKTFAACDKYNDSP